MPFLNTSLPHCREALSAVFFIILTMFNPYLEQLCAQTGMTEWEANRSLRRLAH